MASRQRHFHAQRVGIHQHCRASRRAAIGRDAIGLAGREVGRGGRLTVAEDQRRTGGVIPAQGGCGMRGQPGEQRLTVCKLPAHRLILGGEPSPRQVGIVFAHGHIVSWGDLTPGPSPTRRGEREGGDVVTDSLP